MLPSLLVWASFRIAAAFDPTCLALRNADLCSATSQVDTGVDYYDVTTIDGVNLPIEMRPNPDSEPVEKDEDPCECTLPAVYLEKRLVG